MMKIILDDIIELPSGKLVKVTSINYYTKKVSYNNEDGVEELIDFSEVNNGEIE